MAWHRSQYKGNDALFIKGAVVDEQIMKIGHWFGPMRCVPFSDFTMFAGKKGHQASKRKLCHLPWKK